MPPFSFPSRRGAFLAFALVLLLALLAVLGALRAQREATRWVAHTQEVRERIDRTLALMTEAETGQRGYLLTNDRGFRRPYDLALAAISETLERLRQLTLDNVEQQRALVAVRADVHDRLAVLAEMIALQDSGQSATALAIVRSARGAAIMDRLRTDLARMRAAENQLLEQRAARAAGAQRWTIAAVVLMGALSLLALGLLRTLMTRDAAQIRDSEERLAVTVASVGDAVIATDRFGHVERMNPVAEGLTGWTLAEVEGRPLDVVFHIVNERTREPVESPHHKVLREGKVVGLANHTLLISKDGTERRIEDSGAPIRYADGTIAGTVIVFKDASEQYAAEQAQRDSENRFKAAVSAMEGFLWTNSPDGRMRGPQAGWAALTGQAYEEYQGYGWSRAVHPDDAQPTLDAWNDAVARRVPFKFEHRVRRPDGRWRTFSVRAIPILDDAGRIFEWVGVHTDITEERVALASLREADQRKDEFLATLAHELRNPVAPIRHAIEILDKEHVGEEQQRWSRAVIKRQVNHMARLLDDLLDAARITRGELSLKIGAVELKSIVTEALDVARPIIERKRHTLKVILPEQPVSLMVDGIRIAQVLSNLLTNAAKYTDPGGSITVKAEAGGDVFLILVEDTGIGLSAESLPHVFKMFRQVHSAQDRSEGGLGIGLSLANELIKLHGGRIEVTSAGEGQGSVFSVALPVSTVVAAAESRSAAVQVPRIGAPRLILIIDDNLDAAASLGMLLELAGNEVLLAHSGEEGLLVARKHRPSAIVIDIGLPGMNGYQVAQALRQEPWGREALLIALTGWGQASDKEKAEVAGFDHHLTKPASADAVHLLIATSDTVTRSLGECPSV